MGRSQALEVLEAGEDQVAGRSDVDPHQPPALLSHAPHFEWPIGEVDGPCCKGHPLSRILSLYDTFQKGDWDRKGPQIAFPASVACFCTRPSLLNVANSSFVRSHSSLTMKKKP